MAAGRLPPGTTRQTASSRKEELADGLAVLTPNPFSLIDHPIRPLQMPPASLSPPLSGARSFVSQGSDGVEARGFARRIEAREYPYRAGKAEGYHDGLRFY